MATQANALGDYLGARSRQVRPEDVGPRFGRAGDGCRVCTAKGWQCWRALPSATESTRRSTDRFPKAGEGRCAPSRILQHPPVPQPVEHFGLGSGSFGGSTPDRL
jgi:hypothetical protein